MSFSIYKFLLELQQSILYYPNVLDLINDNIYLQTLMIFFKLIFYKTVNKI